jgi:hypothetical protein
MASTTFSKASTEETLGAELVSSTGETTAAKP